LRPAARKRSGSWLPVPVPDGATDGAQRYAVRPNWSRALRHRDVRKIGPLPFQIDGLVVVNEVAGVAVVEPHRYCGVASAHDADELDVPR